MEKIVIAIDTMGTDNGSAYFVQGIAEAMDCLLYTSDAADEEDSVDLGGRGNIKKKQKVNRER